MKRIFCETYFGPQARIGQARWSVAVVGRAEVPPELVHSYTSARLLATPQEHDC